VTVEETLQLLFVRYTRVNLDNEIRAIFGEDERTEDGQEKEISYSEYVAKVNSRALEELKASIEKKRRGDLGLNNKDEDLF
jgi:hypothetical protein